MTFHFLPDSRHIVLRNPSTSSLLFEKVNSLDVKQGFQLDDELPLVVGDFFAVKLLQAVDTGAGNLAVQRVLLLEVASVHGLAAAHLNLDGDRGLTLLAHGDLLVIALNGSPMGSVKLV
jgi:hypothetical protein